MNCLGYWKPVLEVYRGNDLTPGSLDVEERAEGSVIPNSVPSTGANETETTAAERKREEQIELWMNDIKSFIRNIDVSSL